MLQGRSFSQEDSTKNMMVMAILVMVPRAAPPLGSNSSTSKHSSFSGTISLMMGISMNSFVCWANGLANKSVSHNYQNWWNDEMGRTSACLKTRMPSPPWKSCPSWADLSMVLQRTLTSPSAPLRRRTGIWVEPTLSLTRIPLSSKVSAPGSAVHQFGHFKLQVNERE